MLCSVPGARIVEVFGNGMLPLYRHGDRLVVSEEAALRAGDRIIAETRSGVVLAGTLIHRDTSAVLVARGSALRRDMRIDARDIKALARVLWASQ